MVANYKKKRDAKAKNAAAGRQPPPPPRALQVHEPPPPASDQRPPKRVKQQNGWRRQDILMKLGGKEFCFGWNKTGTCPSGASCTRLNKCQVNGCPQTPPGHRTTQCPLLASKGIVLKA